MTLTLTLVLVIGIHVSPGVRTTGAEALLPWLIMSFGTKKEASTAYHLSTHEVLCRVEDTSTGLITSDTPHPTSGRTYYRNIVRGKYTLQTTTERSMIMFSTTRVRLVSQSFVSVVSYRIRSQSIQDLVLVSTTSVKPGSHLVEHHSLDLG